MSMLPGTIETVSKHFDQYVIYGANGWLGRSTLEALIDLKVESNSLLLVGSKASKLQFNGSVFEILDAESAHRELKSNSLFFNYAFLRREKLQGLTVEEYTQKNLNITTFPKKAIEAKNVKCLVNASSGVAATINLESADILDPYARLKAIEEAQLAQVCQENSTYFINCRIFSLTGKHINEFQNLAISNFVREASENKEILIKSETTRRTYIDATDLSRVFIALALKDQNYSLDSGGTLIDMNRLAELVASNIAGAEIKSAEPQELGTDYFGDFERFNQIAQEEGVDLLGIEDQIKLTSKAILEAINNR